MAKVTISGSVKEKAEAVPFANVYMSDANGKTLANPVGTITDADGKYSLEVPIIQADVAGGTVLLPPSRFLTVSFVGMKTQTKAITSQSQTYNYELEPSTTELNEVEIVAEKPKPAPVNTEAKVSMKLEQTPTKPAKKKIKTSTIVVASVSGLLVLIIVIWAFNVKSN